MTTKKVAVKKQTTLPLEQASTVETPFGVVQQEAEQAGVVARVAREEADIKAAILLARQFPRDEPICYTRLVRSCERYSFAEGAAYTFPRGGKQISGPSVRLARELARCWGNIQYGLRIVETTRDEVHIVGWAWDVETNLRAESEAKFSRLIQRKKEGQTRWVEPDERDLRELINRHGAICYRNALLQILPPDVIDDAMRMTRKTVERAASGELKEDREKLVRSLVASFAYYGVDDALLTHTLGKPLAQMTEKDVADLRGRYSALQDGHAVSEVFDVPSKSSGAKALNEALSE